MNLPTMALLLFTLSACSPRSCPSRRAPASRPDAESKPNDADTFRPDPAWKQMDPNLWFDPKGRRLVIRARLVLREGALEHLLCLKATKEHEAILATNAAPRSIHAGLLLTGAEAGHPVRFLPKFAPPSGTPIAIDLEWLEDGKTRHADARDWVLDERKKTALTIDWVFAGSELVDDPTTKQKYYLADDGDLITVANFASAILDLPIASNANDAERSFIARTDHLPPKGTVVTMFLTPRPRPPAAPKARRAGFIREACFEANWLRSGNRSCGGELASFGEPSWGRIGFVRGTLLGANWLRSGNPRLWSREGRGVENREGSSLGGTSGDEPFVHAGFRRWAVFCRVGQRKPQLHRMVEGSKLVGCASLTHPTTCSDARGRAGCTGRTELGLGPRTAVPARHSPRWRERRFGRWFPLLNIVSGGLGALGFGRPEWERWSGCNDSGHDDAARVPSPNPAKLTLIGGMCKIASVPPRSAFAG